MTEFQSRSTLEASIHTRTHPPSSFPSHLLPRRGQDLLRHRRRQLRGGCLVRIVHIAGLLVIKPIGAGELLLPPLELGLDFMGSGDFLLEAG